MSYPFPVALLAQLVERFVMAVEREGDTTYAQVPVPADSVHWYFVEHMPEAVVNIDSFITAILQYPANAKAAHI